MGIPNIHSATPTSPLIGSSALPQQAASLLIGELTIEGHSYIVSIESSEPLLPFPAHDTIQKIEYLVKLHLEHIESKGINLNDVLVQQLDEDGLVYSTKEDNTWAEKTLLSSAIDFDPSNPFSSKFSLPSALQNLRLTSIREVFRSIIDPLIAKKNEPKKETSPPIPPRSTADKKISRSPRVIFQRNCEEETSVKTPKTHTPKVENRRTEESSHTARKQVEEEASTIEEQNHDEKPNGFWSWNTFRNYVPRFFFRSNSYEVVDSSKEIKERTESFSQKHPEIQEKFGDISNLQ